MEILKSLIPLIIGLLLLVFFTHLASQIFHNKRETGTVFSGVLYEQPVTNGRYKSININNKRIYFSRYSAISQGDYVNLDFSTCKYNKKFDSYENCLIQVEPAKANPVLKLILNLRRVIISHAHYRLPNPHDSLLLAMTIGYKDDLPDGLSEKLRDIGAIHMLVVSGYNVSLVLNSAGVVLMRFPKSVYVGLSVVLLLGFISIAGFDAPIVRSAIMGTFIVLGKAYNRQNLAIYLLFLSGIIMVAWNFGYLSSISFQLSFFATLGVIISGNIFSFKNSLLSDLCTSVGASIFVLPILSFHFGTVSFLGIISSVLLGWLVPLITYLGVLIFLFNIPAINLGFVSVADLFFGLTDFISRFAFLNFEYKLGLRGIVMYYIFVFAIVALISQFKAKTNHEQI